MTQRWEHWLPKSKNWTCAQWKPQHSDPSPTLNKPGIISAAQFPFLPAKCWNTFRGGVWLEGLISEPSQQGDIVQVLKQPEPAQLIIVLWCLYGVGHSKLMERSAGKMNFLPLSICSSNECLQELVAEANHLPNHFIFSTRSLHSLFTAKWWRSGAPSQMSVLSFSPTSAWMQAEDEFMENKRGENIKFK